MNILVIFDYYYPLPMRQTFKDYLDSFGKYSTHRVFYCNYALGIPRYLAKVPFDLIIFHQGFSCQFRWGGLSYDSYLKRLAPLKNSSAVKVLFCQDEFLKMDRICQFANDYAIDIIFTVAEESEWSKIYKGVDRSKVQIHKVLTGYLNHDICTTIEKLQKEIPSRDIDIGYRATHAEPWLGKHGQLKIDIANVVEKEAEQRGMVTDIATVHDEKKFFHGLDWYRFMLRCKTFIGVEGGSSLFDEDGSISMKVKSYVKDHSDASYTEVETACFPGLDGNLALAAISPRHLEACVTKTAQILLEGSYSGILQPNIHYIELKKDYSNLDEVLRLVQDQEALKEITDRAYQDIVLSGLYTYPNFVAQTLQRCFDGRKTPLSATSFSTHYQANKFREWLIWKMMPMEFFLFRSVKKLLPTGIISRLKSLRNRGEGL